MQLSDKLATLNAVRFQEWNLPFTTENAKQAVLTFKGSVYLGLQAESMSAQDLTFAQEHLTILSGLYGLLRPLDLIQPYRLEMGTKLVSHSTKNLYDFWQDTITLHINKLLKNHAEKTLVNLASAEYFKAINPNKLQAQILHIEFRDFKLGQYKIISFYAKKARGLMARYMIKNRITQSEDLKKFNLDNYYFSSHLSSDTTWVFLRDSLD
ncbi:UNVERIFIED_CONTAM: hypothetical protein GTU68_062082 [Idotea baltica]|nr:hypothetical protein [Idotea baltica]